MYNPGSVFQAYALQEYLKPCANIEIIDYRPLYLYSEGSLLKMLLKKLLWGKAYRGRNKKFIGFVEKYMNLTPVFKTSKAVEQANLSADVFMTGSDQLWNTDYPCGNDDTFYLDFVRNGKKISYSTSVGKKNLDRNNLNRLREKLSGFKSISVREKSTAEQLGMVLNREVTWVCDPVLLLPASAYMQFISQSRPFSRKYAVVYLLGSSDLLDKVVDYYRSKGLLIVLAGGFTKRCKCDVHVKDVGPEDFLNLIYHSEIVISSSFHATAFCHVFHKDFLTFLPRANGERIISLLNESSLECKAVCEDACVDLNKILTPIDWPIVDKRVKNYINQSKEFLKKVLER